MSCVRVRPDVAVTAGALAGLAALHAAWGLGSSFPCSDRETLADVVAGTTAVPGRRECFAVAGALLTAALLVGDAVHVDRRVRTPMVVGVAAVLGGRGAVGLAGRTSRTVPWTTSDRFNRLDRRYYGPACIALAAGSLRSLRTQ